MATTPGTLPRRHLLAVLGAGMLPLDAGAAPSGRALRGIFPIAQTPFDARGRMDTGALVRQLQFVDRGGVHGFVWPQLASEWSTLSEAERLEGAEAVLAEGRKLRPAIVIGVQAPDAAAAARYAAHAAKAGADALIALPPPGQTDPEAILAYYREVGRAAELPLFVQSVGNMSVEFILRMWKAVPTLKFIKDEAGEPLMRVARLRAESKDEIKVFTGSHGRTLIDEMSRGTSGAMPAASFADLYAAVWDQWHAGSRKEAIDLFGKALLLIAEVQVYGIESLKYILELRGVFSTHTVRKTAAAAKMPAGGGLEPRAQLDEQGMQVLRELVAHLRPYFRA